LVVADEVEVPELEDFQVLLTQVEEADAAEESIFSNNE
jgi:hypothetical protein